MEAIRFENVYFRYNEECTILRNINVSFNYGEFVLINGTSGSGKSTLISLINGEIPNYKNGEIVGNIFINGENILNKSISYLSTKVGCVLQNADLQIIHDYVDDEIAFGLENLNYNSTQIEQSINKITNILNLNKNDKCKTLSGGQKRRLITASTLVMKQKIVLLDEPLANLDKRSADIILYELTRLVKEENYLVIVVEHRIDLLKNYVNKVYLLDNGELKENQLIQYDLLDLKINNYSTNNKIMELKNINVFFGKKEILSNINLSLYQGERILLLGENGCGKTTLTKIMAKLIKPNKGIIESTINKRHWFKNIGYIFQNPNYQLFMPTVEKEISYNVIDNELKEYLINKLNLKPLLSRHPFSLSEGQKRKVAVCAICALKPQILFLDEPTVGQDEENLKAILECILYLNEKYKTTIVLISHDERCIKQIPNRIVYIKDKMIYKIGGKEIYSEYKENLDV